MPQTIQILPIYDKLFPRDPEEGKKLPNCKPLNYLNLNRTDFSVREERSWQEVAKQVALFLLKRILFPWWLYEFAQYAIQRLLMIPIYPAQSGIARSSLQHLAPEQLDEAGKQARGNLRKDGYIVRRVALEKNGITYSGLLIGHRDTIANGKWSLQAVGNQCAIELMAETAARAYGEQGFNTLFINGPGVGRSEGEATPNTMGDAQEIGISFLETAIKAKQIILAGHSLGGAAMAQAVLQHEFKPEVRYLVISQMTFDRLSNMAGIVAKGISPRLENFAKNLVAWAGCEIDLIAAARKLQDLEIPQIIVQAGSATPQEFLGDGAIPADASLGYGLVRDQITQGKTFRLVDANHDCFFLPLITNRQFSSGRVISHSQS